MTKTMTLSEELKWRGLVYQTTFKDLTEIDKQKLTVYHGFDASADSQTIGNLASMMIDLCFLRHGHNVIVLAGGATSLVGDAGGRDSERLLQREDVIRHNVECAKVQIQKIYGKYNFTLVNNIDWTKGLDMLDFLRDIGKHFNVGEMIKKDIVANRIGEGGSGISYTEFSYSLLQAYDFLHLYQKYNCTLQLCGADQWTNCIAGVDLIKKKTGGEANVLTNPLIINKSTGKKFGKSESGAVWLDPNKTSPFEMYQFWLNTDDESVQDYVKIFTEITKEEYDNLIEQFNGDRSARFAQKYLAFEVTKLVHGTEEAWKAKEQSEAIFEQGSAENAPEVAVEKSLLEGEQINLLEILTASGILESKSKAREMVNSGAVSVNDVKVDVFEIVNPIKNNQELTVRVGKKKYYKIIAK